MTTSLDSSIIAILDPGGNVVGAGFVGGERLILTCAHVVELAGGQPGSAITVRFHQADILIDLARSRAATGEAEEAARLAGEAVEIADRCGYVLQGADAHLELAKLALSNKDLSGLAQHPRSEAEWGRLAPPGFAGPPQDQTGLALYHAREARRLATCDGPPDYTYKVAYEEAGRLLAQLSADASHSRFA